MIIHCIAAAIAFPKKIRNFKKTRVEYEGCAGFVAPQVRISAVEDQFRIRIEGEYIAPLLDTIIIITDFFTATSDNTTENRLEGTYSIIGGKGRFRGAGGTGVLQGRSSAQTRGLGVSLEFEGTIIY